MKKSYLYIAKYFDKHKNRDVSINDKKIGITKNPKQREDSLNRTKGPLGVMFTHLFEFEGENTASVIENDIFHNTLSHLNTDGEWFLDDDYSLTDTVTQTLEGLNKLGFSVKNVLESTKVLTKSEEKQIQKDKISYGKLRVLYNNQEYYDRVVAKTFLNVLSDIGIERCMEVLGDSFITDDDSNEYRNVKRIDGYYIETNNSTPRKIQLLNKIKDYYKLDLTIEVI